MSAYQLSKNYPGAEASELLVLARMSTAFKGRVRALRKVRPMLDLSGLMELVTAGADLNDNSRSDDVAELATSLESGEITGVGELLAASEARVADRPQPVLNSETAVALRAVAK